MPTIKKYNNDNFNDVMIPV